MGPPRSMNGLGPLKDAKFDNAGDTSCCLEYACCQSKSAVCEKFHGEDKLLAEAEVIAEDGCVKGMIVDAELDNGRGACKAEVNLAKFGDSDTDSERVGDGELVLVSVPSIP